MMGSGLTKVWNVSEQEVEFTYVFGEKDELLLVLFQGPINPKMIPILENCENDIKTKNQKILIFVFRDVPTFMPGPHINLAKIQKVARDAGKLVGVCGLRPDIKSVLLGLGIVRENEIFNNI